MATEKLDSKKMPKPKPKTKVTKNDAQRANRKPKAINTNSANQDGSKAKFYALLIGCNFYLPNRLAEGYYGSLTGCVEDVSRVEKLLRDRAGLTDDCLIRLTSTEGKKGLPLEPKESLPTYENIINGFKTLIARATKGDHVFIHYSGHGGRCPTIAPKIKGEDAQDETLVPINIGDKSSRYVRDIEIAKLLSEMNKKKLVVTVVLDSCHSGGATRAAQRSPAIVAVRGVEFVDNTKRPTESLVGSLEELSTVAVKPAGTRGTESTRGVAQPATEKSDCVVLAACRPFELASETVFEGKSMEGALTHWLMKIASDASSDLTFRTLYDQLVKRIHDQFPQQTPMFFGNPDRAVLSGAMSSSIPAFPVIDVSGEKITLGAGQASLVQVGAEYGIFPPSVTDTSDSSMRVALVEVTEARATESIAKILGKTSKRGVLPGDRAVNVGVPLTLMRSVEVVGNDGKAPKVSDKALRGVLSELESQPWLRPVSKKNERADFVVTTDKAKRLLKICDSVGMALEIRPDVEINEPDGIKKIVDRLTHLARYRAIELFENTSPLSRLKSTVNVNLLQTPKGFDKDSPSTKLKAFPTGRIPKLKDGEWVVVEVNNHSSKPINIVILDLSSDWSVNTAHSVEEERFFPIGPNESKRVPLRCALNAESKEGHECLKIIVTVEPPPSYETLYLPPLDKPITSKGANRGQGSGVSNQLDMLLAATAADNPTRSASTGMGVSSVKTDWAVFDLKVEVG